MSSVALTRYNLEMRSLKDEGVYQRCECCWVAWWEMYDPAFLEPLNWITAIYTQLKIVPNKYIKLQFPTVLGNYWALLKKWQYILYFRFMSSVGTNGLEADRVGKWTNTLLVLIFWFDSKPTGWNNTWTS